MNAAWCPHCAANSWPLAIALSRFSTLSGLREVDTGTYYGRVTGERRPYSHTTGISFFGARLRSAQVAFAAVVIEDRDGRARRRPTRAQRERRQRFDRRGFVPAVALGQRYGTIGATYSPALLKGLSAKAIVDRLADPDAQLTRAVIGEANLITAALCAQTAQRPADVCAR